jgi:putative transposase
LPTFSTTRGAHLLTVAECAAAFGASESTIRRALKKPGVYVERQSVPRADGRGGTTLVLIDPVTLPLTRQQAWTELQPAEPKRTESPAISSRAAPPGRSLARPAAPAKEATLSDLDLEEARERVELLRPILRLPSGNRRRAIKALARKEEVSPRTVYDWINRYESEGISALASTRRADRGRPRIPAEAYQLIVQALISNTPQTSTRMIHRTLMRAVPTAMEYERAGQASQVSVASVRRIRQRLLDDPHARLLFFDADKRKEHLRTYAGQVFAAHANQLWQMDMTRCDVMVCDPETKTVFRPRIHAIMDVYSGTVPGLAFALEEDQTQTDLALLRAFVPKPEPYTDAWPVFGTPQRMYWDNGKTYSSEHARRVLSDLGVEVVYSKPRVSHTRGAIERFFGTFHGFEKTLPGYVGENAKNRSTEELRRVTKNTERWHERSGQQDPGWGNRLLTLTEYQQACMDWLIGEYHDWQVDGKSRLEHFLETAPRNTQRLYSRADLMLTLARRTTRTVNPDGSIRLNNRRWTVESGELINHAGREVLVLSNQFGSEEEHLIAWRDASGKLQEIGRAIPVPDRADSEQARELRHRSQAQAKRALQAAREAKRELTQPELVVSKALRTKVQAELNVEALPTPDHPRARLEAVDGDNAIENLPDDDFTRSFGEALDYRGMSPKEYLNAVKRHYQARGDGAERE